MSSSPPPTNPPEPHLLSHREDNSQPTNNLLTNIPESLVEYTLPPHKYLEYYNNHPTKPVHRLQNGKEFRFYPQGIAVGGLIFVTSISTSHSSQLETRDIDPVDQEEASTTTTSTTPNDSSIPEPYILLIRRSRHDSHPLRWEIAGGGADWEDGSVLESTAREVREETGLSVSTVKMKVGDDHCFMTRRGMKIVKVNFWVECTEVSDLEEDHIREKEGGGGEGVASEKGRVVKVVQDLSRIPVRIDPKEHEEFAWVRRGDLDRYTMTTREQLEVIRNGFDVYSNHLGLRTLQTRCSESDEPVNGRIVDVGKW